MSQRTLFIQFSTDQAIKQEQVEELLDVVDRCTPDDVSAVVVPDEFELMTQEQVEQLIEDLQNTIETG